MPASILEFLSGGLLQLGWWGMLAYLLVVTQLTIFSVTLYLHRSQAHRGVDFHPLLAHFFRFWTLADHLDDHQGMGRDPSQAPRQVRDRGRPAQPDASRASATCSGTASSCTAKRALTARRIEKYGKGCPDDWIERHLYTPHATHGSDRCCWSSASRCSASPGVAVWAMPDGVDPVLGRRRHQRPRPLVGLPQLRDHRHRDQPHPVGVLDRRRGAAQQPPRVPELGEVRAAHVRVRHRLGGDQDVRDRRPGQGAARRAGAGRAPEHRDARRRNDEGAAGATASRR